MSRTEPLAPANLSSSSRVAIAMNSAATAEPSRWRRLSRPRTSCEPCSICCVQSISATSRDDAWNQRAEVLPEELFCVEPVSRSMASDRNARRASPSIDQMTSGAFWTRYR